MELYLIRHGETVDNVAGLYAGVRDSALTIHGHQQAQRLGEHFAKTNVLFTHVFASPLSRAFKTAQAIEAAQPSTAKPAAITKVPELIEQNFGYYEGKPFHARSDPRKSGRESHRDKHKDDPGFVDVESKESLNQRADTFLDEHIMPMFDTDQKSERVVAAIVSHGMLLSHLWRQLLLRLPSKSVTVAQEVAAARGNIVLQHLSGWSNTGYLELSLSGPVLAALAEQPEAIATTLNGPSPEPHRATETDEADAQEEHHVPSPAKSLTGWSTLIRAIDSKAHLVGLKRQRGGIGRSAHDEGQKKLDGFFKRQRTS